jgi:hypothetical protein
VLLVKTILLLFLWHLLGFEFDFYFILVCACDVFEMFFRAVHTINPPPILGLFFCKIAAYFKNSTEYTNTLCRQNAVINMFEQVVHIVTTGL